MSIPQSLYDSEINFTVSTFWDTGLHVRLGDEMNGYVAEATLRTWAEVERWLVDQAVVHYPNSTFAQKRERV